MLVLGANLDLESSRALVLGANCDVESSRALVLGTPRVGSSVGCSQDAKSLHS